MPSRISWTGLVVGAFVGGISRVTVLALHYPDSLGGSYPLALVAGTVGLVVGGIAGGTGRALLGAVVGAGLSLLFYLSSLVFVGLLAFLGGMSLPALWEVAAVGAIPGAIGGAVGQIVAKRTGGASAVGNP